MVARASRGRPHAPDAGRGQDANRRARAVPGPGAALAHPRPGLRLGTPDVGAGAPRSPRAGRGLRRTRVVRGARRRQRRASQRSFREVRPAPHRLPRRVRRHRQPRLLLRTAAGRPRRPQVPGGGAQRPQARRTPAHRHPQPGVADAPFRAELLGARRGGQRRRRARPDLLRFREGPSRQPPDHRRARRQTHAVFREPARVRVDRGEGPARTGRPHVPAELGRLRRRRVRHEKSLIALAVAEIGAISERRAARPNPATPSASRAGDGRWPRPFSARPR